MKINNLLGKISSGEIKSGDYIDLIRRENKKITFLGNGRYDRASFNDFTLIRVYIRNVISYYPKTDEYEIKDSLRIPKNTILDYEFMIDSVSLSNAMDSLDKDSKAFRKFKTKIQERKALWEEGLMTKEIWG